MSEEHVQCGIHQHTCFGERFGRPDWTSEFSAAVGLQAQQMNKNVTVQLVTGNTFDPQYFIYIKNRIIMIYLVMFCATLGEDLMSHFATPSFLKK